MYSAARSLPVTATDSANHQYSKTFTIGVQDVNEAQTAMTLSASSVKENAAGAVIGKLTGDPSLRYTDGGRAFLRWMTQHAMHPDEWREFVDAIPERWLEEVRQAAAAMSEEWGQFANQLGCRQGQEAS